ncbi:MAG: hypothetical protein ACI89L_001809 [Phycisphaerales bacterium]
MDTTIANLMMPEMLSTGVLTLAQSAPEGAWVPMLGAFAGGLVLWIMGGKVLKPAFAIIGAALGGFAGIVVVPLTGLPAFEVAGVLLQPQVLGMVIGGLIGLAVAVALFKFIITLGASVVFAAAGVLTGLIWLSVSGQSTVTGNTEAGEVAALAAEETGGAYDAVRGELARIGEDLALDQATDAAGDGAASLTGDEAAEAAKEQLRSAAEASRAFIASIRDTAMAEWDRRSTKERAVIFGGGAAGFVVGLLAGAIFTRRATAIITALAGSAVWLTAGVALLRGPIGLDADKLAFSPNAWAVVWGGMSFIGLVLQLGVVNKKRSSKRDDDDDDDD